MRIIIADTWFHASAMVRWLKLDPDEWRPVRYGQRITGPFHDVKLVRPLDGASDHHFAWVMSEIMPFLVGDQIEPVPVGWR